VRRPYGPDLGIGGAAGQPVGLGAGLEDINELGFAALSSTMGVLTRAASRCAPSRSREVDGSASFRRKSPPNITEV
jgi:hypothetical protein